MSPVAGGSLTGTANTIVTLSTGKYGFTTYLIEVRVTGSFTNYSLDYRSYLHMTRRSLLAWRLSALDSEGPGAGIYALGGYNELRGYDFRELFGNRIFFTNIELRYPLIDELRFPFGSLREMRGTIFFDAGTAYFDNGQFFSRELNSFREFGPVGAFGNFVNPSFVRFKLWDSENNRPQDLRASWGLGFHFLFGGLEWHWDFAHQFPYTDFTEICVGATFEKNCAALQPGDIVTETRLEKIEVKRGGARTNFWIGFSF